MPRRHLSRRACVRVALVAGLLACVLAASLAARSARWPLLSRSALGFAPAWLTRIPGAPGAGTAAHAPLPNEAYLWQRSWTPAVVEALHASAQVVRGWHVLAAEYDRTGPDTGRWSFAAPDWRALAATGAPVTAVFRIDGQVGQWDDAALVAAIAARLAHWRAHGVAPAGIEIDYDCATARLAAYARFLHLLRGAIGTTPLSITALPTWLQSADLDGLLAASDAAVLQLHAVMNPAEGLFDPERAWRWTQAFSQRTARPWRVALPAYGSRVTWGSDGHIVAIESERPTLVPGGVAHELIAQPEVVRAFVARLDAGPPRGLVGILWFRLPTDADVRAWSLATWRAVLARDPLKARLEVLTQPSSRPGLYDVRLVALGNADSELPRGVRVARACTLGDGVGAYTLDYDRQGRVLRRTQPGLLRAGSELPIGWLRCGASASPDEIASHVEP